MPLLTQFMNPLALIKDPENFVVDTGYQDKNAIPISDFSPENYGGLIAQLAVTRNGLYRECRKFFNSQPG